jgi:hypothetical protein
MARFNFRIGTKLGLTAGIGVVLVGGMLANQLVGNQSVATVKHPGHLQLFQQVQCADHGQCDDAGAARRSRHCRRAFRRGD